jgi:hypothetical protein
LFCDETVSAYDICNMNSSKTNSAKSKTNILVDVRTILESL